MPALVLCGREDALTPPELHREMAAAIPDAVLVVLPRCGHMTTLERPERTRQLVELSKVVSDQVPGLPLYFNIGVVAFTSNLKGPEIGTPESLLYGNLHEWTMS